MPNAGLGEDHALGKKLNRLMNSEDVVKNNDYTKVRKFVDKLNISDEDKEKLKKSIIDTTAKTTKITDKIANFDVNKEQFFREQGLDINNMSSKELRRMRNQLGIDVKNEDEKEKAKSEDRLKELKEKDEKAKKLAEEKRMNMIGNIVDYVSIIAGYVETLMGKTKSSVTGKPFESPSENFETSLMTNEQAKAEEAKSRIGKDTAIDAEFTEVKDDKKKPEITINADAIDRVVNLATRGVSVSIIAKRLSISADKVKEPLIVTLTEVHIPFSYSGS